MDRRYLTMLKKMKKIDDGLTDKTWSVYILRCADGTFYTGISNNVERRINQHNSGKGAAYTRPRRPVELIYHEPDMNRPEALMREARIKMLPRTKKEELVTRNSRGRRAAQNLMRCRAPQNGKSSLPKKTGT